MTNTTTATETIRESLATIATRHAVPCRCGNGATIIVTPDVTVVEGDRQRKEVLVFVPVNATITRQMSYQIAVAIRREFGATEAAIGTLKNSKPRESGYGHMGRFHSTGFQSRHWVA